MAAEFTRLDEGDRLKALAFLERCPERNAVMLCNISLFGMDGGERPLDGYYFGCGDSVGLTFLGAVYNVGSMFFYTAEEEASRGVAAHLLRAGKLPSFTQGPPGQIKILLDELEAPGGEQPFTLTSEWQALRGRIHPDIETGGARPARMDELDELVRLGRAMHGEVFAGEEPEDAPIQTVLALQIEHGSAFVIECGGVLASKAEATVAAPHAALIGGVYTVPEFRGRGLSTRCVGALCEHMLGLVEAVTLSVEPDNPAAYRMYRNIGFVKEADWMIVSFGANREGGGRGVAS